MPCSPLASISCSTYYHPLSVTSLTSFFASSGLTPSPGSPGPRGMNSAVNILPCRMVRGCVLVFLLGNLNINIFDMLLLPLLLLFLLLLSLFCGISSNDKDSPSTGNGNSRHPSTSRQPSNSHPCRHHLRHPCSRPRTPSHQESPPPSDPPLSVSVLSLVLLYLFFSSQSLNHHLFSPSHISTPATPVPIYPMIPNPPLATHSPPFSLRLLNSSTTPPPPLFQPQDALGDRIVGVVGSVFCL